LALDLENPEGRPINKYTFKYKCIGAAGTLLIAALLYGTGGSAAACARLIAAASSQVLDYFAPEGTTVNKFKFEFTGAAATLLTATLLYGTTGSAAASARLIAAT
jgi:hypothetical protein